MASSSAQDSCEIGASTSELSVVNVVLCTRNPEIWLGFDLCEMSNGSQKARCKGCGQLYSASANTTLKSHRTKHCKAVKNTSGTGQSQMSKEGGVFNFNLERVRRRMAEFVIQQGLPFNHFDNLRLTSLIRDTLQPSYTHWQDFIY